MRRMLIVIGTVLAACAVAAPAEGARYGMFLGHARASGSSSAVSIGWGPKLWRQVRAPRSFTVVVRATLRRGYLCSLDCGEIQSQWQVACTKPGSLRNRMGGMFGPPPKVGHPLLPFSNARTCTVRVEAHSSQYVGGTIDVWLYYRR